MSQLKGSKDQTSSINEVEEVEAAKSPKKARRKDRIGKSIVRGQKKHKVTF